jgi:hypothetical protein
MFRRRHASFRVRACGVAWCEWILGSRVTCGCVPPCVRERDSERASERERESKRERTSEGESCSERDRVGEKLRGRWSVSACMSACVSACVCVRACMRVVSLVCVQSCACVWSACDGGCTCRALAIVVTVGTTRASSSMLVSGLCVIH